jgi:putative intracellular protease/amidase
MHDINSLYESYELLKMTSSGYLLFQEQQTTLKENPMKTKNLAIAVMMTTLTGASAYAAPSKGKVLVIVSSAHEMQLQDGKTYTTGFYLNELTVPVRKFMENGYDVVFANPKGNTPVMDVHSDSAKYFDNDVAKYQDYKRFLASLSGLKHPARISDVIDSGLDQFAGVFFPGGHAPMVDLLKDPNVGKVLNYFHETAKPTALICHGPISILSTIPNAQAFVSALASKDEALAQVIAKDWTYAGYNMTIFSTAEEQHAEAVQLGGNVQFYPDEALRAAGGNVNVAAPWTSNVIRDRELITGQNPFSDNQLADELLSALNERKN